MCFYPFIKLAPSIVGLDKLLSAQKLPIEGKSANPTVENQMISCGGNHGLLLDYEGCVWGFGSNGKGQLGASTGVFYSTPRKIEELPKIVSVSAGEEHSLFLDTDGFVWSCGRNANGELGYGNAVTAYKKPQKINNLPRITSISAGNTISSHITEDGSTLQSGDMMLYRPTKQFTFSKPIQECSTNEFSLFINSEGVVYTTQDGEAKIITNLPRIKAVSTRRKFSLFLDVEGNVWASGTPPNAKHLVFDTPSKIEGLPAITEIAVGGSTAYFLDFEGIVWKLIDNMAVTPVELLDSIKHIAAGDQFALFVDEQGNAFSLKDTVSKIPDIPPIGPRAIRTKPAGAK